MTQEELDQRLQKISDDIDGYVSDVRERYVFTNKENGQEWQSIETREHFLKFCLDVVQRDITSIQEDLHN